MYNFNHDIERVSITSEEIQMGVNKLGAMLTADYADKNPLFVCILKGSTIFFSDLIRATVLPLEVDFITVKSYHKGAVSSGKIDFVKDLDTDIAGRHVVLVEDIIDSANTLTHVIEVLLSRSPASLRTAALLDKQVARSVDFTPDYKCFDIENEFIVGYGLDYAERYRNLPFLGVLKREVYE